MSKSITWVGIDAHKTTLVVAILVGESETPIELTIENTQKAVAKLSRKLSKMARGQEIRACYEAGTCGFTLQRWFEAVSIVCEVIAPSLIPRKPGERIKTDRRDARKLVMLFRAGLLTTVSAPTPEQEAVRDLCRCREQARLDLARCKDRLVKMLVRRGHIYDAKKDMWTIAYRRWLDAVIFENAIDQVVFAEYKQAIEQTQRRLDALNQEIEKAAQLPLYGKHVAWLRCFRGVDTIVAMVFIAELHGIERFESPRKLAAYLGLVPSLYSSNETARRGSITKAGNRFIRRVLVQASWHYRRKAPASRGRIQRRRKGQPERVIAIAEAAERRLSARYARLTARKKNPNKVVIAIARELVGFLWAALRDDRADTRAVTTAQPARHGARSSAQLKGAKASTAPRSNPTPAAKTSASRTEVGQRRKAQ